MCPDLCPVPPDPADSWEDDSPLTSMARAQTGLQRGSSALPHPPLTAWLAGPPALRPGRVPSSVSPLGLSLSVCDMGMMVAWLTTLCPFSCSVVFVLIWGWEQEAGATAGTG